MRDLRSCWRGGISTPPHPGHVRTQFATGADRVLARISHQLSAAGAYLAASTAASLALDSVLNVVSTTLPRIFLRAPSIHGHLRALATTPGEKCGLGCFDFTIGNDKLKRCRTRLDAPKWLSVWSALFRCFAFEPVWSLTDGNGCNTSH